MILLLFFINSFKIKSNILKYDQKNIELSLDIQANSPYLDNKRYIQLELSPKIDNIYKLFSISLRFTFLSSLDEYKIKYGLRASESPLSITTIKYLKIDNEYLKLRYGEFDLTYGYDLIMYEYISYGLIGAIEYIDNHTFKFTIPLYDYFKNHKRDLYAFRYEFESFYKYSSVLGFNYFRDNSSYKFPSDSFSIDLFIDFSDYFNPYIEIAKMIKFGSALSLGFRGSLNILNYDMGYKFLGKGFIYSIYDEFYEHRKEISDFKSFNNNRCLNLKIGLDIEDRFEGYLKFEDFKSYKNIIIKFYIKILKILKIDFKYKKREISFENFKLFNGYNSFNTSIEFPLFNTIDLSIYLRRKVDEPFSFGFKFLIIIYK